MWKRFKVTLPAIENFPGEWRILMKRFFTVVLCLFVLASTLAVAEATTRRHKSRFGRKARTAAMIAGGAGVGTLVGGRKGAAIGAGGAGLYAFNRKAARRPERQSSRFRLVCVPWAGFQSRVGHRSDFVSAAQPFGHLGGIADVPIDAQRQGFDAL